MMACEAGIGLSLGVFFWSLTQATHFHVSLILRFMSGFAYSLFKETKNCMFIKKARNICKQMGDINSYLYQTFQLSKTSIISINFNCTGIWHVAIILTYYHGYGDFMNSRIQWWYRNLFNTSWFDACMGYSQILESRFCSRGFVIFIFVAVISDLLSINFISL